MRFTLKPSLALLLSLSWLAVGEPSAVGSAAPGDALATAAQDDGLVRPGLARDAGQPGPWIFAEACGERGEETSPGHDDTVAASATTALRVPPPGRHVLDVPAHDRRRPARRVFSGASPRGPPARA